MSTLNQEISRLESAKSAINEMLISKGVSIPENATLDTYADLIGSIKTGKSFNKVGEIIIPPKDNYVWHEIPIKILCDDSWWNPITSPIYLRITNIDGDVSKITDIQFPSYIYGIGYDDYIIIEQGAVGECNCIGYRYAVAYNTFFSEDSMSFDDVLFCDINMSKTEEQAWIKLRNNNTATILTVEYGYYE